LKEGIVMTKAERKRLIVMNRLVRGELRVVDASVILGVSYRQCQRIWKRYVEEGDSGIVHRSRGTDSNHKIADPVRELILSKYGEKYEGFGPTLASEKLEEEDGLKVDHETLRRWLIAEGMWKRRRKRKPYRKRRDRREHFGEFVQLDGSHHDWFESREKRCCLMNMVDDATGISYSLMGEEETTEAAMRLLWGWIERYGIPMSLYCDKKTVYRSNREPTIDEQLEGKEPRTAFGLACEKLGIEIILANSPQAKGRVERNHGVYQDRLVKELRLKGIHTIEETNFILKNGFVDKLNAKFAVRPASEEDYHVALEKDQDLRPIFCFEAVRNVSHDWVVQNNNRLYQIDKDNNPLPRPDSKVTVCEWLDGSVHILFKDKELDFEEITLKKKMTSRRVS